MYHTENALHVSVKYKIKLQFIHNVLALGHLRNPGRDIQEEPQAEAAANPRHQDKKKWHRLTCA